MQDLIERSDVIKMVRHISMELVDADTRQKLIEAIPAVEPKRGIWVRAFRNFDQAYHNYCSVCKEWNGLDVEGWNWRPNFCPNCGADMRGKDDED